MRANGKVLAALREAGQDQNTVIVFASDHGEGLAGHRWARKASFYEASLRVPFLVAGPGVAIGVNGELTTLADIVPTMCALAGIPAPEDARGVNVRTGFARPFVTSELRYGTDEREGRMLRTKRYKYNTLQLRRAPRTVVRSRSLSGIENALRRINALRGILHLQSVRKLLIPGSPKSIPDTLLEFDPGETINLASRGKKNSTNIGG